MLQEIGTPHTMRLKPHLCVYVKSVLAVNDGEEIVALAERILAAAIVVDPREFTISLVRREGIHPDIAWLALGCAQIELGILEP